MEEEFSLDQFMVQRKSNATPQSKKKKKGK